MRRLFIIRKDLNLHPGKLAAMVGHCAECYWMNLLTHGYVRDNEFDTLPVYGLDDRPIIYRAPQIYKAANEALERGDSEFTVKAEYSRPTKTVSVEIPKEIWDGYINDIFTKTICEAKNLNHLMKVVEVEAGLLVQLTLKSVGLSPLTTSNDSSAVDELLSTSQARNRKLWRPGASSGML